MLCVTTAVAVVAVDQTVTVDTTETFRFVNICATTNNTLERAFNLSIFTEITGNNGKRANVLPYLMTCWFIYSQSSCVRATARCYSCMHQFQHNNGTRANLRSDVQ